MTTHHVLPDPAQDPACTALDALLTQSLLEPAAAEALRVHLTGCSRCRTKLAAYERLDNALRQHVARLAVSPFRAEDLTRALEAREDVAQREPAQAALSHPFLAPSEAPAPPQRYLPPRRRRFSWVAAIAAVLALIVIAAALFVSHHQGNPSATEPSALPISVYGTAGSGESDTTVDLFALNAANGKLRWKQPTPPVTFPPVVERGVLYAADIDGNVWAFNANTGRRLWITYLSGPVAVEQVADGVVYAMYFSPCGMQSFCFALVALDAATGRQLWQFTKENSVGALVYGVAYAANGVVYVTNRGDPNQSPGMLYALDARTGGERWHFQGQGYLELWELVDGQLYLTGDQSVGATNAQTGESLYAVDANTGKLRWSFPRHPSGALQRVAMENGLVYLLSNTGSPAPGEPFTTLYALNASDGSVRWQHVVHGDVVPGNGILYAGTAAGDVAAYRASDGAFLWRAPQIQGLVSGLVANGTAYLLGQAGGIFALDADTGKVLWSGGPGQIGGVANGLLITRDDLSAPNAIYGLDARTGARRWTYYPPAQQLELLTVQ